MTYGFRDEQPDLSNDRLYIPHWLYNSEIEGVADIYLGYTTEDTSKYSDKKDCTLYYEISIAGGSDYSGEIIHKANFKSLEEYQSKLPEGAMLRYNAFPGGYGWLIRADVLLAPEHSYQGWSDTTPDAHWIDDDYNDEVYSNAAGEVREMLYGTENYCIIDEDLESKLEMEDSDETWESSVKRDFISYIRNIEDKAYKASHTNEEWIEADDTVTSPIAEELEAMDEGDLRELFETQRDKENAYWEDQGSGQGMWIDYERIADAYYNSRVVPF